MGGRRHIGRKTPWWVLALLGIVLLCYGMGRIYLFLYFKDYRTWDQTFFFVVESFLTITAGFALLGGAIRRFRSVQSIRCTALQVPKFLRPGEPFMVRLKLRFDRPVQLESAHARLCFREVIELSKGGALQVSTEPETDSLDETLLLKDMRTPEHEITVARFEFPGRQYMAGEEFEKTLSFRIPPGGMHSIRICEYRLLWGLIEASIFSLLWCVALNAKPLGLPALEWEREIRVSGGSGPGVEK